MHLHFMEQTSVQELDINLIHMQGIVPLPILHININSDKAILLDLETEIKRA